MESLRDRERFKEFSLLQFGDDGIVAKGWFRLVEKSEFGTPDALDPAAIAKPDASLDCVISCHIITKIPDHKSCVHELSRVLSPRGIAYLSYPNPATRTTSLDWGFADPSKGRDFRILGADFEPELARLAAGTHIAAVKVVDPVTGDRDLAYVMMKDFFWMRRIAASKLDARFVDLGDG